MNNVEAQKLEVEKKINLVEILSKYGLIAGFIVLCVVMSLLSPVFFTEINLINILRQVAVTGVISVGMTFAIISGGIDLSVGSILAFAGFVMVSLENDGPFVAVTVAVLSGVV